jgi:putative FmdB family regulatory protein
MPIYAYRCIECGFAKDVLQKMSDEPLTICPECSKESFKKQVTAAGFQLKGSGWYVTDFRNGSSNAGANNSVSKNAEKTESPLPQSESAPNPSPASSNDSGGTSSTSGSNSANSTNANSSSSAAGSSSSAVSSNGNKAA